MGMNERSKERLHTCHPDLIRLVEAVAEDTEVVVIQGIRTLAEQERNVAKGVSWTMNSKHLLNPARAVDMAPAPLDWADTERFIRFAEDVVIPMAKRMGIGLRWGGAWKGVRNPPGSKDDDLVHYELKEA